MAGLLGNNMTALTPLTNPTDPNQLNPDPGSLKPITINDTAPLQSFTGYNPSQRVVNPATDTVQGQIQSVIANDSPLMQQARTSAGQVANKRGLLNSSMGVQAGEAATYAAALPIAQADATIYSDAGNRNLDARNAALQFTGNSQNTAAGQSFGAQTQLGQIAAQGEQTRQSQAAAAALDLQTQTTIQNLRGDQATNLANVEASFKTLMQTNDSAGKLFQQSLDSINKILVSDLDAASKQAAVDMQNEQLKNSLSVIGKISNIPNLNDLLVFTPRTVQAVTGGSPTAGPNAPSSPQPAPGMLWSPEANAWIYPGQVTSNPNGGGE